MKTKLITQLAALLLLSILNPQLSTVFAQGSLTPPGAPAPVMKSLDQIEPRTIVNAVNTPGDVNNLFIISQPGSYYLAGNLTGVSGKHGIEITANNVTLDLNGFALSGVPGSINGVNIVGSRTNTVVRNGSISGWVGNGVNGSSTGFNLQCERLNVSSCSTGIWDYYGVVSDCTIQSCANSGIYSCYGVVSGCTVQFSSLGIYASSGTVSGCTVQSCGSHGMSVNSSTVSGCTVQYCGNNGIYAQSSTVSDCSVQSCIVYGIYALSSTVTGCRVTGCTLSGIYVDAPDCVIVGNNCKGNNTGASSSSAGIFIDDANNRIEDNHVSASGYAGISVAGGYSGNIIVKNSVSGNGANNYLAPGSQIVGPLITNYGTITNTSPWANFSF